MHGGRIWVESRLIGFIDNGSAEAFASLAATFQTDWNQISLVSVLQLAGLALS